MADGTNSTSSTASLNNNPPSSGTTTASSSLPSTPNHSSSLQSTTGSTSSSASGLNHNATSTAIKSSQNFHQHQHHHHQQQQHHHHHQHHHPNASGGTTILTTQPTKMLNSTTKLIGVKQQNVIHRTTSECMRLSTSDRLPQSGNGSTSASGSGSTSTASGGSSGSSTPAIPPTTLPPLSRKSKTSSFQITSVTVGTRTSADTGEDSADDLDESHTDDNSRITDLENETPSFSEDTFSKEDVFFSTNAIGTAPVIPTSSQYGLAIVTPDLAGVGGEHSDVHVSVTDSGLLVDASGKHDGGDLKEVHHRNERFKVVKIESTEPFKRGRWMCMDYLDHTALQPTVSSGQQSVPASVGPPVMTQPDQDTGCLGASTTTDSGLGMSASNIDLTHLSNGAMGSPQKTVQTDVHIQNMINTNLLAGQSAPPGAYYPPLSANSSPGQSLHQPISMGVGGVPGGQTLPSQISMPPTAVSYGAAAPPVFIQSNPIPGGVATSGGQTQQQPILNNTQQPMYHHQSLPAQPQHPQSQPPLLEHQQQPTSFHQQLPPGATPVSGVYVVQSIPPQPQQPQQLQQQTQQTQSMVDVQQHIMTNMQQGQSQPAQFYASTGAIPNTAGATVPSGVHHLQGQTLPAGVLHNIVQNNISGIMQQHHQPQIQQSNQYIPAPTQMQQVPPTQQPQTQQQMQPLQQHQQAMSMGHQPQHVDMSLMQSIANQANFQAMQQLPQQPPQLVQLPPQQAQSLQQPIQMVGVNLDQHSHYAQQQPQQQLACADRGVTGVPFSIAQSMPHLADGAHQQQQQQQHQQQFIQNQPPHQQPMQQLQQPHQQSLGYASSNHLIGSTIGAAALVQAAGSVIVNNSVPGGPVNCAMQVEVASNDLGAAAAGVAAAIISPAGTAGSASAVGGGDEAVAPAATGASALGAAALAPGGGGDDSVANPTTGSTEDSESASGTSAVAIDNKIEQAMDLVKSHLMFAVREEVEVLKEKIAELMDRINQLELENTILKANASQDTLIQLSSMVATPALQSTKSLPNNAANPTNGPIS